MYLIQNCSKKTRNDFFKDSQPSVNRCCCTLYSRQTTDFASLRTSNYTRRKYFIDDGHARFGGGFKALLKFVGTARDAV